MTLTVVILTKNEEQHVARAINSVLSVADRIFVIDSNSSDKTVEVAVKLGASVLVNSFITQAKQFNWALNQLPQDTKWILRLDADEIVSPELAQSLREILPKLPDEVASATIDRRMTFMRRPIRWGGIFPIRITRVFRHGRARSEDRWMDEHIIFDGSQVHLKGELLDDTLKPLGHWVDKHNAYASREVIEILDAEFKFLARENSPLINGHAGIKRWIKEKIYARLPGGLRAVGYFGYRYFLRLGFLDGAAGAYFHVLQGFWYRYLVDAKLYEIRKVMKDEGLDVTTAIYNVFGINVQE